MNTKAQRLEGKQTQTVGFLVASTLSLARMDRLSHSNTHSNRHTHAYRPSMSSSPACVDKYMCVRVCPLRVDHNAQLARRERPECVSVVRSGAPSLSTFSTVQVLSAFSSSCPPLFFNIAFLSLGHSLACSSVCLLGFVQTLALPRFLPMQIYKHTCRWKFKRKKERESKSFLELQRHLLLEM